MRLALGIIVFIGMVFVTLHAWVTSPRTVCFDQRGNQAECRPTVNVECISVERGAFLFSEYQVVTVCQPTPAYPSNIPPPAHGL